MNERERFYKYFEGAMPGNKGFELHMLAGWDARAEIAKQDEKEMVDALKECALLPLESNDLADRAKIIKFIEKHTGKTWEELNV